MAAKTRFQMDNWLEETELERALAGLLAGYAGGGQNPIGAAARGVGSMARLRRMSDPRKCCMVFSTMWHFIGWLKTTYRAGTSLV